MKSASLRSRIVAARKGLRRVGFKPSSPKGFKFYINKNAVPVKKGSYFTMENVEYLAPRDFLKEPFRGRDVHGPMSYIMQGTVKFKGRKPMPVVIKTFTQSSPQKAKHLEEVVKRLSVSSVSHPKMGVLHFGGEKQSNLYLVMEAFTKRQNGAVVSKLEPYERTVNSLRLFKEKDRAVFESVLVEVAKLAKVGLVVPYTWAVSRDLIELGVPHETLMKVAHKQIDAITKMDRIEGDVRGPKIMVQDIDEIEIAKSPKEAWERSIKNIFEVMLPNNERQRELMEKMAERIKYYNNL